MRLFLFGLGWLLLAGCTQPSTQPPAGAPLVFVHGFKGSVLRDAEGGIHWISGVHATGWSSPPLAFPERKPLRATEVLREVTVIPWVAEEDVYGSWMERAERSGRPLRPFVYDWRQDNLETLAKLERFVAEVRREFGGARVHLVGHSMGGLLGLAAMNRDPSAYASVVLAGVPTRGGIGFLPDLQLGTSNGLNATILEPRVVTTFPSVYTFFPLDGSGAVDKQGAPLKIDYFSAAEWRRWKLGVCRVSCDDRTLAWLSGVLARAKKFREGLKPVHPPGTYPPVLVVNSREHEVLGFMQKDGPQAVEGWDFLSQPRAKGDGRVAYEDSLPPEGIPHEVVSTGNTHSQLLNDPAVARRIFEFEAKAEGAAKR